MRYVKYDTALRYIKDAGMRIGGVWGIEATAHFEHEPSIEIIHCGECKMWMSEHLCQWWSRYGTVETDADDFCSYGERKENE